MHLIILLVLMAAICLAMCYPLWTALSEAHANVGPHNSSTLELALLGLGTLAIFWLVKQARKPRANRPADESSASVPVRYAEAKAEMERESEEAAEHAA